VWDTSAGNQAFISSLSGWEDAKKRCATLFRSHPLTATKTFHYSKAYDSGSIFCGSRHKHVFWYLCPLRGSRLQRLDSWLAPRRPNIGIVLADTTLSR
jgi:hypothetical protein